MNTWPQNAYVGQKVVCLRTMLTPIFFNSDCPQLNQIYTISEITKGKTKIGIQLKELRCLNKYGYFIGCFRPAQSTEAGMSILREILITQKVKEDA